ncbi:insulinase family protein, partial [Pluralibacter gergoviae]
MIDVHRLTLANGLRCHLVHQPQAREAAALLKVDAGSLQEPDRWPGLAHLLEHLLFADSADFRGEERLMPWAQRRGGLVNASTRLGESAFFFQAGAGDLPVGLARLVDMLAAPLLLPEAITQEIAVIDAEYRLLQTHADTLCEAALFDLLPDPPSLG